MESAYVAAYADLYRRHWWWRARERILLATIERLLSAAETHARILDVGCGAGLFFDALSQVGHVEGIESDATAVENAGPWRHRIFHGQLDSTFEPTAPYDAILMLDVLEHVPEPGRLLARARTLLKPNGRLVLTLPAFRWLWTAHDDLNHHLHRYTRAELRRMITRADLDVEESRYLFPSLVLAKLLVRAREAVFHTSDQLPTVPPPAINSVLESWLRAEFAVARWLPFGTSVMAVAKLPLTATGRAQRLG